MTTKEKEVLLAFYKEQLRYNEALSAFMQMMCEVECESEEEDSGTVTEEDEPNSAFR